MNVALHNDLVSQVTSALDNNQFEVLVKVKGSWLIRNNLQETWKQLRNTPDQVIDDDFTDYITLFQAECLGLIKEA